VSPGSGRSNRRSPPLDHPHDVVRKLERRTEREYGPPDAQVTSGVLEGKFEAARPRRASDPISAAVRFCAVVGLYVGAAKLGLALSVAHGVITPVWAPTGIALAALLLLGRRLWPAILVAAFIANATSGASIPVALAISVGNTLEAVVGRELLVQARFRPALDRVRDVFLLIALGAVASTAVSATNGVTTLWVANDLSSSYGYSWFLWWIGDAMGDLIVASLLLVVLTTPWRRLVPAGRRVEAVLLLALLGGLSSFVFLAGYWRYPHLLFPLYIWATLRFARVGATTSSFVVATIAIAGAVSGHTPLTGDATHVVQVLEGLLAGVTISVLILGAALAERTDAETRLAEAQEVAHVGSWTWDIPSGRVGWSDELYRLYGIEPRSDMTFERYLDCVHPDDRDAVHAAVQRALLERAVFSLQHRALLPDGRQRWLHGRGRVVVDAEGTPVGMVGTSQDVTERKQVDELRETILAAVSHELRTPLTSIIGFSVTLKERALDPELRARVVQNLLEQSQKLERLLADLLDLDRLRRGFVQPRFEETNLGPLVERVVGEHRSEARPIVLDATDAVARVDAPKVERIVDNLLANAVRHTPEGTEIAVRVAQSDGGVVIAVEDRGAGVSPDERRAIFEAFRRGARADATPGTGIGLSLVAQFAELHGGRAWVEENPRGGASFRVFLPAQPF
jgi:PAS domain S-box-containing protein